MAHENSETIEIDNKWYNVSGHTGEILSIQDPMYEMDSYPTKEKAVAAAIQRSDNYKGDKMDDVAYNDLNQDEIPNDSAAYALYKAENEEEIKNATNAFLGPLAASQENSDDDETKTALGSVMKKKLIEMTEENFNERKAVRKELEQIEVPKEEPTGFFDNISSWWSGKKEEWAKPNASRGRFPADGWY
jgi:hypothetical protein